MVPPPDQKRHRRRRRRRRAGGGVQHRPVSSGAFPTAAQLPSRPEEAWDQTPVKTFAAKRKKDENHLSPLLSIALPDLQELGEEAGVEGAFGMTRGLLLRSLVRQRMEKSGVFFTKGHLDIQPEGHAYLRHGVNDYTPNIDTDALLHRELVEKHNLVSGQEVSGVL
ncbi:MAG: hypothetical protein MK213_01975, partial [Planctomycetes bacterium]|nr:hypothetical protein [Planctomycetota bacterium]